MKKLKTKENKGITLIALVVTTVVLILLAGTSINFVLGDNGIITKAQQAKMQTKFSKYKEELDLFNGKQLIENQEYQLKTLTAGKNSVSYNTQGVEKKINVDRQLYTYGVKIKKVDNKDENTALQGAEFALKKGDTEIKFAKSGKMYYPAADGDAKLTTDGNGEMLIAGLDLGTYTLTETKAPSGYTLPRNPETTITLSEKDAVNGTLDESKAEGTNVKANSASVDTQKTWQLNFVLTNGKSNFNLPITGGIGTAVFTIGGIMIMAGAVMLLTYAIRRSRR